MTIETIDTKSNRQLEFLKSEVAKFISHKKKIIENSIAADGQQISIFNTAYDVLKREIDMAADYQLNGFVNVVLRNLEHLEKLLPHKANDSYISSLNCLDKIRGLCLLYKMENNAKQF
jgi:hypothetical protein